MVIIVVFDFIRYSSAVGLWHFCGMLDMIFANRDVVTYVPIYSLQALFDG